MVGEYRDCHDNQLASRYKRKTLTPKERELADLIRQDEELFN